MKIFAVIVTYNAMHREWITRCMESLSKSSVPVVPVIVDNGSTDGTRDFVPAQYPDAVWFPQDRNLGFGQANNIGISYALHENADYVLLLNQDATIHPFAIERMLEASNGKRLVSPLQLNGEGSRLDEMFRYRLLQAKHHLIDDVLMGNEISSSYETGDYAAACWLIPRFVLEEVGGFNPLFFHYGEDDNYLQRLKYHKIAVCLAPKAYMYHDRQGHGNNQVFKKNHLYRQQLLVVTNINHSFFHRFAELLRLGVLCYVVDLPRGQYKVGYFIVGCFRLLSHLGKIRRSCRTDRERGRKWL